MRWCAEVIFLLLIKYTTPSTGTVPNINLSENLNEETAYQNLVNTGSDKYSNLLHQYEDAKLEYLGRLLVNILLKPWPRDVSPVLYVENLPPEYDHEEVSPKTEPAEAEEISNIPFKRSRYYRKYPWKRQNSRYDAENRYLCQPTKDDVFRLLVALHEARQGNRGQTINFCNRKRPASVVFTNIRFLG